MPADRVRDLLRKHGVSFSTQIHDHAVTAQEVAAAEAESGWHVAKPVLLFAGEELVMAVVSAPLMVDLEKTAEALGSEVRIAEEDEFAPRFDDCETGAEPIFGSMYGVPVVVDERLAQEQRIRFAAGTHTETIEVVTREFLDIEKPRVAEVSARR